MMMFLLTLVIASASASPGDDYSVADIDCSQPGPRLSASLTKPRGYGGAPVFADRSVTANQRPV